MALLPPPDIGAAYVDEEKRPSKDFYNWIRSLYELTRGIGSNTIFATAVTVAQLPPAGIVGRRHFVTDADNPTTFDSIVSGGGPNALPVYDDGTNWRIG